MLSRYSYVFLQYLKVVPQKKGLTLGIGSVNNVPRAILSYAQQREDETAHLRSELNATQTHLGSLESFLENVVARNPHLEKMLQLKREQLGIPQPCSAQEQDEEMERRSQDFFQELQNNPSSQLLFCIINLKLN